MGWIILAAFLISLSLLVWRRSRRLKRSGYDKGAISPDEMGSRVYGSFVTGKDPKFRKP